MHKKRVFQDKKGTTDKLILLAPLMIVIIVAIIGLVVVQKPMNNNILNNYNNNFIKNKANIQSNKILSGEAIINKRLDNDEETSFCKDLKKLSLIENKDVLEDEIYVKECVNQN
jgi:hypothetical protein